MLRLEVPLVTESGRRIGFGDRWQTHRVRKSPGGLILGQRHVGVTIACVDDGGRILVAHRRHKIFDRVWTLSGDTHPYKYEWGKEETIFQAARRCAEDDFEATIKKWKRTLTVSYSARDPRDPRYCENELLHVMVARYSGLLRMNPKNAYELRWVGLPQISEDSMADMKKEPIERKYAPWVHAAFSLPTTKVEEALLIV
jgi:isopentenyldiphosphate isomerase